MVNLSPIAAVTVKLGGAGLGAGIGLNEKAGESCLSVVGDSVAAAIAKPGEQMPSRGKGDR